MSKKILVPLIVVVVMGLLLYAAHTLNLVGLIRAMHGG